MGREEVREGGVAETRNPRIKLLKNDLTNTHFLKESQMDLFLLHNY